MMDWHNLLSTRRLGEQTSAPVSPLRNPFQKDWDRIVFSSAFRRLQDKTQVHSLAENDYVRTRLTHSMEAAAVGRSLGTTVGHHLTQRHAMTEGVTAAEFGHVVAAAALAHDIGNPPFGHFGEATIRSWFAESPLGQQLIATLPEPQAQDFLRFEGNAQGFRILTRLQNWRDSGGLRLTAATLGAFSKYPRLSILDKVEDDDAGAQKFGVYQADAPVFTTIASDLGLLAKSRGYWCRHPLAYLVEAADDICYRIVDLEDGFKLGRVAFSEAEALLMEIVGPKRRRYDEMTTDAGKIAYLRAKAIGRLIGQATAIFLDYEREIMAGSFAGELLARAPMRPALDRIADITETHVFKTAEREHTEREGAKALEFLLNTYMQAFATAEETGLDSLNKDARLAPLLNGFGNALDDRYHWLLQVTDYISGMTDSYLLAQFDRFTGRSA